MFKKIVEMIQDQLDTGDMEITMETKFKDDLNADSLDLFELVMSLEEEYEVEIPSEDLEEMVTVGDIVRYLNEKGIA